MNSHLSQFTASRLASSARLSVMEQCWPRSCRAFWGIHRDCSVPPSSSKVYVEGLVHICTLGEDYFHFDAQHYRLLGERTRETFQLGDDITVRVANVNLDERKIDFERVTDTAESPKKRRSRKSK